MFADEADKDLPKVLPTSGVGGSGGVGCSGFSLMTAESLRINSFFGLVKHERSSICSCSSWMDFTIVSVL